MNVDKVIRDAVQSAVDAGRQGPGLAEKIVAWFEAVGADVSSAADSALSRRHIALLLEATDVEVEPSLEQEVIDGD